MSAIFVVVIVAQIGMTSFVLSVPWQGWCEKNISEFCRVLFPGHVLPVWFTRTYIDTHTTHYRIRPKWQAMDICNYLEKKNPLVLVKVSVGQFLLLNIKEDYIRVSKGAHILSEKLLRLSKVRAEQCVY